MIESTFCNLCGYYVGCCTCHNSEKQHDTVKNPSHYQGRDGMEVIDVIRNFSACPEYEEGFYWCNVVKYLLRFHSKNGVEDLKKARRNLDWLIEKLEENK